MSASFHNSQQEITKIGNLFYKLTEILAENSVIPRNSRREFLTWRIPGNSRTGIPGGLDLKCVATLPCEMSVIIKKQH